MRNLDKADTVTLLNIYVYASDIIQAKRDLLDKASKILVLDKNNIEIDSVTVNQVENAEPGQFRFDASLSVKRSAAPNAAMLRPTMLGAGFPLPIQSQVQAQVRDEDIPEVFKQNGLGEMYKQNQRDDNG